MFEILSKTLNNRFIHFEAFPGKRVKLTDRQLLLLCMFHRILHIHYRSV